MFCVMEMIFPMLSVERSAWSSKVRSKPREPKCVVISLAWRGVAKMHKSQALETWTGQEDKEIKAKEKLSLFGKD